MRRINMSKHIDTFEGIKYLSVIGGLISLTLGHSPAIFVIVWLVSFCIGTIRKEFGSV